MRGLHGSWIVIFHEFRVTSPDFKLILFRSNLEQFESQLSVRFVKKLLLDTLCFSKSAQFAHLWVDLQVLQSILQLLRRIFVLVLHLNAPKKILHKVSKMYIMKNRLEFCVKMTDIWSLLTLTHEYPKQRGPFQSQPEIYSDCQSTRQLHMARLHTRLPARLHPLDSFRRWRDAPVQNLVLNLFRRVASAQSITYWQRLEITCFLWRLVSTFFLTMRWYYADLSRLRSFHPPSWPSSSTGGPRSHYRFYTNSKDRYISHKKS